jgi:hypothetical protein
VFTDGRIVRATSGPVTREHLPLERVQRPAGSGVTARSFDMTTVLLSYERVARVTELSRWSNSMSLKWLQTLSSRQNRPSSY